MSNGEDQASSAPTPEKPSSAAQRKPEPKRAPGKGQKRSPTGPGNSPIDPRRGEKAKRAPAAPAAVVAPKDEAPDADTDAESTFARIKTAAQNASGRFWVIVGGLVLVVAIVAVVASRGGGGGQESTDNQSGDQYTISYREQLTQSGFQAGCFVLMQGTRAIGLSCLPLK